MGSPITGTMVWAASTPPRWAAFPAAAMMTPKPFSSAVRANSSASAGVRWADMTRASKGTPNFFSWVMAPLTTGKSLSEPMMTATFFKFHDLLFKTKNAGAKIASAQCVFFLDTPIPWSAEDIRHSSISGTSMK